MSVLEVFASIQVGQYGFNIPRAVASPGGHGWPGVELGRARHGAPGQAPVWGVTSIAETLATHSAIAGAETRINTMRDLHDSDNEGSSLVRERLGVCPGHPPAPHELGAAPAPAVSGFRIRPGMTNKCEDTLLLMGAPICSSTFPWILRSHSDKWTHWRVSWWGGWRWPPSSTPGQRLPWAQGLGLAKLWQTTAVMAVRPT